LYCVTEADGVSGTVTFSINPDHHVWEEDRLPVTGNQVVLADIRMTDKGWRAYNARFLRPEDNIGKAQ
jgi:hypothetical protein